MSKWEEAVWLRVEARIAENAEGQKTQSQERGLNAPPPPALWAVSLGSGTGGHPEPGAPHPRGKAMKPESPIRILIADDSPPVRRQLRRLIELQIPGAVIEEAEDGRVAVEKVTQTSPDVAILDIEWNATRS